MTDKHVLSIQKRDLKGKQNKQLRREGVVPANLFGSGEESLAISLGKKELVKMLLKVGETPLFYLKLEDKEIPALVDELQTHPLSNEPEHVSFKRVNLKEKISSEIPIELVGENNVSAAVVVLTIDVVEVEALPTDLPEKFELDISQLTEIGQSLGYDDLAYDKAKVKLVVDEENLEDPIVLLQEVKEEVVEEIPEAEEGAEGTSKATEEPDAATEEKTE